MHRYRLTIFSILIFSGVFFIYLNYNQHEVTDARWVLPTAQSLAKEQNFTLNEYQPLILQNNHYGIDSAKGNAYSFYPIGTSLFAAPVIWLANNFLHESPGSSVGHKISTGNDDPVSLQLAALVAALASLFIFLAAFQKTKNFRIAILAAVVFAFATPMWSTAGVALRQQGVSALLFSMLLFIFSLKNEKWIGWCGLLLGYAFLVSPINFWILLVVAILVFREYRSQFVKFILSASVVFIAFFFYSYHIYGKIFAPHYWPSSIDGDYSFLDALVGNLFSPARGLFFFSPVLLFAIVPLIQSFRNRRNNENFYWALCIAAFLVAASLIKGWWGGWCYGPCLMTSITPFFIWFVILFLEKFAQLPSRSKLLSSSAFALAILLSVFAQARGALSKIPYTWNYSPNDINSHPERLWQLSDLQMLRGLAKPPEKNAKPEDFGITADYTTHDQVKFPSTMYDERLQLQELPSNYYRQPPENTFRYHPATTDSFYTMPENVDVRLQPFGFSEGKHFLFEYTYPAKCNFSFTGDTSQIPVVAFPEDCLSGDSVLAKVILRNHSAEKQTFYLRLFYQNTSYSFPVTDSLVKSDTNILDNFYGNSAVKKVTLNAGSESTIYIPYSIGPDPRHHLSIKNRWRISARPGNYEFMLLALPSASDPLMAQKLNLDRINPFAEVKNEQKWYGRNRDQTHLAYVPSEHFKFVFLDDDFDGRNNLEPDHVYYAKDRVQKPLCDTCKGFYKNVISDKWTNDDFNKGFIAKAPYVKAEYGNRLSNVYFKGGIAYLKIPGSTEKNLQKTWGEILFEPSFKYGHISVRAKFCQMFNPSGTPNGIVHNLWLYQRDYRDMPPDPKNPYHNLVNSIGTQPYEIDFEIWSSITQKQVWDDSALINYSVVDYMRDPNVDLKPDEVKQFGNYIADRSNGRQINIPGKQFPKQFFNYYHLYEIYWTPAYVRYVLDGKEVALITQKMAKIPDQEAYLWIGSPIYQDGTYYAQTQIPFLPYDMLDEIDWIRIE